MIVRHLAAAWNEASVFAPLALTAYLESSTSLLLRSASNFLAKVRHSKIMQCQMQINQRKSNGGAL